MRKVLWQAWVFITTWLLMPLGSVSWWIGTNLIVSRPWSFLIAACVTLTSLFLMWYWVQEYRGKHDRD